MKKTAFTLAEVLLVLIIIGVIASLTIPSLINTTKMRENQERFKKAYASLNQITEQAQPALGHRVRCYYNASIRPHYCSKETYVKIKNDKGETVIKTTSDGSPISQCEEYRWSDNNQPIDSNPNGPTADCADFLKFMVSRLNVIKTCKNCLPNYYGKNTRTDSAWRRDQSSTYTAYYLADGSVLFNDNAVTRWAIDVNGLKGPNKWGYDVWPLTLVGDNDGLFQFSATHQHSVGFIEEGGKEGKDIILNK